MLYYATNPPTGSGKTTVARRLSQRLAIPHVELDALRRGPNWILSPPDLFRQRAAQATGGDAMLAQPIGSAALSRMPAAIESLAVWSVVSGFLFLLRSLGFAYNEQQFSFWRSRGFSRVYFDALVTPPGIMGSGFYPVNDIFRHELHELRVQNWH